MKKILVTSVLLISAGSTSFAFSPKKPDATAGATDTTWIARADGSTSCNAGSGQSLEDGAAQLKSAGVTVFASKKGNDGKMHALSCGMATGNLNEYQISKQDLARVTALGFQEDLRK